MVILRAAGVATIVGVGAVLAMVGPLGFGPAPEPASSPAFDAWRTLVTADTVSPVTAGPADLSLAWTGADGRPVRLVVKAPADGDASRTVTVGPVAPGDDARPAFRAALDHARQIGARRIVAPKGRYLFRTMEPGDKGHLWIHDLKDVTIDGQGSTLVFGNPGDGLRISAATRVKLTHMSLDYAMPTWSTGKISVVNGDKSLALDNASAGAAAAPIAQVSGFDPQTRTWPSDGPRLFFGKKNPEPSLVGANRRASPQFRNSANGQEVAVKLHHYEGSAIDVYDGLAGPSSDLTFEDVHVLTATGTGFKIKMRGRGLAIVDSSVAPDPASGRMLSAEYDAIHVAATGGDVLIRGNRIRGQGDDAMNVRSPIYVVDPAAAGGSSVNLSDTAQTIAPGDAVAFFDGNGNYLFKAVVRDRSATAGENVDLALDRPLPDGPPPRYARDLALTSSRYAVVDNDVSGCECHGLLAQVPNGLVRNNRFTDLRFNAIRLLTSLEPWREGTGAFNVIVEQNTITRTGPDSSLPVPWGAINVYGLKGSALLGNSVNADIIIRDNTITNVAQACFMVTSSRGVTVTNNKCDKTQRLGDNSDLGDPVRETLRKAKYLARASYERVTQP
jgi:hypothetical protein